jgi:hypothetical protein
MEAWCVRVRERACEGAFARAFVSVRACARAYEQASVRAGVHSCPFACVLVDACVQVGRAVMRCTTDGLAHPDAQMHVHSHGHGVAASVKGLHRSTRKYCLRTYLRVCDPAVSRRSVGRQPLL